MIRGDGPDYVRRELDVRDRRATSLEALSIDAAGDRIAWVAVDESGPRRPILLLAERVGDSFETTWEWAPPPDALCPDGHQEVSDVLLSPDGLRLAVTVLTVCEPEVGTDVEVRVERFIFE